jgi:hypothetical protein
MNGLKLNPQIALILNGLAAGQISKEWRTSRSYDFPYSLSLGFLQIQILTTGIHSISGALHFL